MERSQSGSKDSRLVQLKRQGHSRIKVVVVREMRLYLIADARRYQKSFRNHDVRLYEGAEFELVDLDQRVTGVLRVQRRYASQIVVDR